MKKTNNKNIDLALRQLLLEGKAGTHEDICSALEKQGYSVSQPKISRLLHKIGAIKVTNQEGQNIYRLPHEHGLMHELNRSGAKISVMQWVIDIAHNGSLIVVHTYPGAAAIVARDIDLHHTRLGIMGSIAGDDTIFVAPKDVRRIDEIVEQMSQLLGATK